MSRKLVLILVFLMLYGSFAFLFARPVAADQQGPIYIRADGSIDPITAPISTVDNGTYTLTGDLFNNSIMIEKGNIVVDGAFHIIDGTIGGGGITGIAVSESTNVTIENFEIRAASVRIGPYSSYITIYGNNITGEYGGLGYPLSITNAQNNTVYGNNITNNGGGISLYNSRGNSIYGNNIMGNNAWGIGLSYYSGNNTISRNNIENNTIGIGLDSSSNNNTIYYNNFMNNAVQATVSNNSRNIWDKPWQDDDLIWGGNYWSDYNGSSYLGVVTTPYVIDENNIDNYPWAGMFNFYTFYDHEITIISNSSIYDLDFELTNQTHARLIFKTDGPSGTEGFIRICIPNALIASSSWSINLDGQLCGISFYVSNLTAWNTEVEYLQSVHWFETTGITTVPEFPSFLVAPLFMVTTLLAIVIYKRRRLT